MTSSADALGGNDSRIGCRHSAGSSTHFGTSTTAPGATSGAVGLFEQALDNVVRQRIAQARPLRRGQFLA